MTLINKIKMLEDGLTFEKNHIISGEDFNYVQGNIPILVSAPRGINLGKVMGEQYTEALTKHIYDEVGCHLIYKAAYDGVDYENYDECEYKRKLVNVIFENDIKFFIEMSTADNIGDIDLLICNPNLEAIYANRVINIIKECFAENDIYDIHVKDNHIKTIKYPNSVYVQRKTGIEAISIKIKQSIMEPVENKEMFYAAIKSFDKTIKLINEYVHNKKTS